MFPDPTELLLTGDSIESIWIPKSKSDTLTPKTNSQTFWPREISHVMSGIIFCVLSSTNCFEVMSRRPQKDSGEERTTAKSKPMMNLVLRFSERTPDVLAFTASESPRKTRYESQLPLSSWNEQRQITGRLVLEAHSSSYSEWNADKSGMLTRIGLLKSGNELMEVRTGRPVYEQPPRLCTDRFIVDDDDVDRHVVNIQIILAQGE